ncbi:unnamed protein product [Phytophthora lilii]|uniref:Unnamed protein product n=1 Tax=Phytophthora lilii TaxID=2077276 RepID=A0A9W6XL09_9STRA|nr:unnamed protein product [Phytophthora lilii]
MVANLRVQLQDKDRALNAVHLQHRVDRSDYRAAVAKYSAEVAQLNRLLQISATPVSPSAQPAGASHGSPRSPSSRPTNPGKRPLSKGSAAGLSLAAAGLESSSSDSEDSGPRKPSAKRHRLSQGKPSHPLGSPSGPSAGNLLPGSPSPASASHASLALTQQSSVPSGAATPSPPDPRAASPAAPEVIDLSGDDQVDEAHTSVDTSHEIPLSTPKRRDGRPTREASVTASLRSNASLEEFLASDDLVLGPQSPSDDTDGPPSPPSGAASKIPVVRSSGVLTSQASVVVSSVFSTSQASVVVSSVSSTAQASAAPSSPPSLPPASVPAPTDASAGVLTGTSGYSIQVLDAGIRGKWGPDGLVPDPQRLGAGFVAVEREDPVLGGWDPGLRLLRGPQPSVAATSTEDAGSPVYV